MELSPHYLSYPHKTLIIVTNNQLAKLFVAEDREVVELQVMPPQEDDDDENLTLSDEERQEMRDDLYGALNRRLEEIHGDYKEITLCAPEVHREAIFEAMNDEVQSKIQDVIPKNLASLPIDQIVRILQENRE